MKVRIGNGSALVDYSAGLGQQIQSELMGKVRDRVVRTGRSFMRALAGVLEDVGNEEADQLFAVLSDIIDNPSSNTGISALDLERGMQGAAAANNAFGRITWRDLTYKYLVQKDRLRLNPGYRGAYVQARGAARPPVSMRENRFFRYQGYLADYFRNQGRSIVQGRMGGVRVTLDEEGLETGGRSIENDALGGRALERFLIGRFQIDIFPYVDAVLLPGLASRRWTETLGHGQFEEELFDGAKTAAKLVQTHHDSSFYRALVAPAVQFWVLVRIPAVLKQRLNTYLSRANLG